MNKQLHKMLGYYTIRDAAAECGVEYATLYNMIRAGVVTPPTHKIGGNTTRPHYTRNDVRQIKTILEVK